MDSFINNLERIVTLLKRLKEVDTSASPSTELADLLHEVKEVADIVLANDQSSLKRNLSEVFPFLGRLVSASKETTAAEVLSMIVEGNIIDDAELVEDVKELIETSRFSDLPFPQSAFMQTAALLVVSRLIGCLPKSVVISPLDAINIHLGTRTLIIDGSDVISFYDFGPQPSVDVVVRLSDMDSTLSRFLDAHLSIWEKLACTMAFTAVAPTAASQPRVFVQDVY